MTNSAQKVKIEQTEEIFENLKYICDSTSLIVESLKRGLDIAQLPSGDIIITEVKTINTLYSWDVKKNKLMKINQS